MIMLEAKGLNKRYGKLEALKNFELTVNSGDCLVLLGPNGAGKSTFLKLATNIVHPTSGYVSIKGSKVNEDPMKALSSVGPLIELPEFYPYLNGIEILSYVCRVKGADRETVSSEVSRLTEELKMDEYIKRKSGQYSRGMKQRLALACAMAMNPEILILDEPTFGLDPKGMREFVDIIKDINIKQKRTVILSTHLISEAREIASRVVIINNGEKKIEIANDRDTRMMNITMYNPRDLTFLEKYGITLIEMENDKATIGIPESMQNDDVLSILLKEGIKVKWAEPSNSIERKYLEIVK
ncbi:ABC transporter ATP-binding protein [Cuniculiplasma sp. SKW3]|uniref:ABC transporter ATP-binding protein n=1 Tax=Cuniculiplasma sp. SKW3 TaxID=3400170 RepID=UPI003FD59C06